MMREEISRRFVFTAVLLLLAACVYADSTVVFNEIMYHPADETDATLEWVELYNKMAVDMDISGWSINGFGYTFPASTVMPARSYLVVAVSLTALTAETGYSGALGPASGQLSNSGETLKLTRPDGRVMDRVKYEDANNWPVETDGTGVTLAKIDPDMGSGLAKSWTFSSEINGTLGAENFPGGVAEPISLMINEIDSSLTSPFRIELVNDGSASIDLGGYVLASSNPLNSDYVFASEILPDGSYKVVDNSMIGWTAAMAEGDRIFLYSPDKTSVVDGAVVKNRLRGRFPEATGQWAYPEAATFGIENTFTFSDGIKINEIMYHAFPILETGGTPGTYQATTVVSIDVDWRYNQTGDDLGGDWFLSAHPVDNQNWFEGSALLAKETAYLPEPIRTPLTVSSSQIIYYFETEFNFTGNPADMTSFQIQHIIDDGAIFYLNGVELYRFNMPEGELYAFPGVGNAVYSGVIKLPVGSLVSGSNRLSVEVHQTSTTSSDVVFGASLTVVEETVPPTAGTPFGESDEEWVEIRNDTLLVLDLTEWSLDGGIDYEFPPGTTMLPKSYLVVAKDAATLIAKYPAANILGNFSGGLANGGDTVELKDENGNIVDTVTYLDGKPWPEYADGGGSSLERKDLDADPSDPQSWAASNELGDSEWETYTYRGIAVEDSIGYNIWHEFCLGLLDTGEVLLDDISVIEDPDGAAIELIQNGSFEFDTVGYVPGKWRLLGNHGTTHGRSIVVADPDDSGNKVLHLVTTGYMRHEHNHGETTLAGGRTISAGKEYEISFRGRWVAGCNRLNTRLYFNWLQKTTNLDVPETAGTCGGQNSMFKNNIGPTYSGFTHTPIVPNASQSVTVLVCAIDPDGIYDMKLYYSVNEGSWTSTVMSNVTGDIYTGTIPGRSAGDDVQFYVKGRDLNGLATSYYPAAGADSRAMFTVQDGMANTSVRHTMRIVMAPSDWGLLLTDTNLMSNHRLGATVIYDERKAYYDVGVRLKGSGWGRTHSTETGFNIAFFEDDLFRGVHRTISIERGSGNKEVIAKHLFNNAAGGLGSLYDDVAYLVTPNMSYGGVGLLSMARYTGVFLDSWNDNGSDGSLYNLELLYTPTGTVDGNPESLKLNYPYSHTNGNYEIQDFGDDNESYRWNNQLRNNFMKDDFSLMIDLAQSLELSGQTLDSRTKEVMDVSQWMRTWAMMSLVGNDDIYTRSWNHNFRMVQRPEDNRMLALPWDLDRTFRLSTNASLWGSSKLQKVIELTGNKRLYYGHLRDMIETTYNSAYMSYWTSHYGSLTGRNFGSQLSYIGSRAEYVSGQLPSSYPFAVTDPNMIVADAFAEIHGKAWIDMKELYLDGIEKPLELSWTSTGSGTGQQFFFNATIPVEPGINTLTFNAYDFQNRLIATHAMTVTSTVNERPLRGYLRVTEIMYDPAGGSDDEFVELHNTSSQPLDLTDVTFVDGITFAFATGSVTSLAPGEYVLVVRDLAAFSSRYNTAGLNIAGEFSGKLANDGETVTLQGKWASKILSLTYADKRGWPFATDGAGHSLVPLSSAIEAQSDGSADFGPNWRASSYIGGSPGASDPEPAGSVVINEVCAHTDFSSPSYPDHDSNDWVELYNISDSIIALNGDWYLSDDKDDLKKWSIGSASIPVSQWLSFDEISDFHNPIDSGFGLDKAGEQVFLSYLPGNAQDRIVDCIKFKGQPNGSSLSRYPDGANDWYETALTRNAANTAPHPMCVISEIMYHPDAGGKEFIELKNLTSQPLSLWDNDPDVNRSWRLDGGVSFEFDGSTSIPANGFLLVVGFDPNEDNLETFNSFYGTTLTDDQVVGPYSGDLSNNTERVALERSQASDDPLNPDDLSWIIVDEAIYFDQAPWPYGTDGTGQSAQRKELSISGNNPANWQATPATPGYWISRGDFSGNGTMGVEDLEIFALAWLSETGDANWNADCDFAEPFGTIDLADFAIFVEFWHEPTLR